ncbi:hypothetical protein PFICI_07060 [Pestalotiopsis fici W106-1]|uniref:SET domain-containing protein n=1 Tax=Pestalotiopsis fici (strain W106-1 / CGMCC3.15140) TaxID=1229662 RepID=W3X7G3_PESFW|nr:uncharacterized protein PFICI_07060 [Pestalotiopsis fici W106-1]ETS82058.1 hypothetical protein PFICI_07060 [Pestalotiopsis fici W106-1]
MKSQQILLACATGGVAAKNSLGYMVDYGRCQWENFLGNFENPFCEYDDPSAFAQVSVAEPKSERTAHAVETPFISSDAQPVKVAAQKPAEPVVEKNKVKEEKGKEKEAKEEEGAADPKPRKAEALKIKNDKLIANELWPISSTCAGHHNETEEFCIFSNPNFAGGRGITILTTPAEAVTIAKSPAFTERDLYKSVKDFNAAASDKWHVEEVPNKGMGLVASRNLAMGDHIMSVSAAIMTDFDIWDHVSVDQVRRMQTEGISHLPKHHRDIFMNLSTHDGADSHEEQIYKIILTNAFDISDEEIITRPKGAKIVNFFTVFPEVSRMNHDCRPNAHYYWDPDTFTQNVFATRDILAGEEITITYVELLLPRDDRLARLDETWHFPCACTACTQVDRIVKASDDRIAQILDLQGHLTDYTGDSYATPEMAETLVSLYEQERLYSRLYEAYTYAAIEFNAVGKVWEAIKYARLAIQHSFVVAGPNNDDHYELAALAENPTTHWSHLMRRKDESESVYRSVSNPITTSI